MKYNMKIFSTDPVKVFNRDKNLWYIIEVGKHYIFLPSKPTTKKDRANNGREVEIFGFSSDMFGDAIVKYADTGRRGRVNPCCLVPVLDE